MIQNLLQLRKYRKAHKPAYDREDEHKIMALRGTGWRKPNGLHSKMRHRYRGQPAMVEPGWGSPRAVRGMHATGLWPIQIHTLLELAAIKIGQGAVIGSDVGARKRLLLIAAAEKQKVMILNIKNPAEYAKKIVDAHKVVVSAKTRKPKATVPIQAQASAKSASAKTSPASSTPASSKKTDSGEPAGSSTDSKQTQSSKQTGKSESKSEDKSESIADAKKETKKEFDKLLTKRDA